MRDRAERHAVDQDRARRRLVHAEQQLHQRRLARAVLPDDRHRRPGGQREGERGKHRPFGARVAERQVAESIPDRSRAGAVAVPARRDGGRVVVLEPEQAVGGRQGGDHPGRPGGGRGQLGAGAADQRDRHQHGAERDGAVATRGPRRTRSRPSGPPRTAASRPTGRRVPCAPRGRHAGRATRSAAACTRLGAGPGRRSGARPRRTRSRTGRRSVRPGGGPRPSRPRDRFVIRFAIRSATSGGTAATGSSSSHGDTEPSSTSRAMMRAADETLRQDLPGRGGELAAAGVEPLDLGEVVGPLQVLQRRHAADQLDHPPGPVDGDPVGQRHRLGRADGGQHPGQAEQDGRPPRRPRSPAPRRRTARRRRAAGSRAGSRWPATEPSTSRVVTRAIQPGAARKPSKNRIAASRARRRGDGRRPSATRRPGAVPSARRGAVSRRGAVCSLGHCANLAAWIRYISAYVPPAATSSSWLPRSVITPPSST